MNIQFFHKKWKVFICHASKDKIEFVDDLVKLLQTRGEYLWYDEIDIPKGVEIDKAVQKGLKEVKGGIVIFSSNFIRNCTLKKREWVYEEFIVLVHKKHIHNGFLIPIFYEIDPDILPKSLKDPLDNINGFTFSKKNGDNIIDLSEKIHKRLEEIKSEEKAKRKTRILTISSVFILLSILAIYINKSINKKTSNDTIYSITPFDTTKDSYNVLLLPFQPLEMCRFKKTNIESTIISHLNEMSNNDSLNLSIKYDTLDCLHNYLEAESIAKKSKANLVIWGDLYEHCTSDNEASLRFVNVSSKNQIPGLNLRGESGIERISSLSEVREGKLQRNTDYIIYWVAASRFLDKRDYKKALHCFSTIKKSYITTPELYSCIGMCYFLLGFNNEAKDYFEEALNINSNYEPVLNNYGILLHELGEKTRAKEYFDKALNIKQDDVFVHLNYAHLLEELGDTNGAKKHFELAINIQPNDVNIYESYAFLLEKTDELNEAKKCYEKMLDIKQDDVSVNINYAHLLEKLGDINGVKEHFEKAININQNDADLLISYASLLKKLGDLKRAKKYLKRAVNLTPKNAWVHRDYAYLLKELNDLKGAKEYYKKAVEIDPGNYGGHEYAYFLEELNDLIGAKAQYDILLKKNEKNAYLQFRYASLLMELGDLYMAKEHFDIAVNLAPTFIFCHFNYAVLLEKLNDLKGARGHFEIVVNIDSNYAVGHSYYANLLAKLNDQDGARKHYERALEIDSNSFETHYWYAILLKRKFNDLEGAKKHYLKAVALNPEIKTIENDNYFGVKKEFLSICLTAIHNLVSKIFRYCFIPPFGLKSIYRK